ncbi:type VI secretion system Vgr family protein [Oceanospirillum sanctuarii]|uniref:type VI secretion system Vgr family protein n=1 Tax=Oceanospirillum sanctuarii TaxID=1434821 RepID=UPI000A3C0E8E|nr:type VI secretion system tip protein TssI/VgrG [Oceanospirillum sanctuarii]
MSLSSDVNFSFQCDNIPEDEFRVLQFNGTESLGDLYQFEIQLISYSDTLDTDALLDENCTLTIESYGKKRDFNGILSNFNYLKTTENGYLYQATLVPRLWLLSQFTTNEVYLGLNLSETLTLLFDEAGLTSDEYDLSLINSYRKWDYRCQFGESHYSFLKRITEREGVYFFFEQNNQKSKAVFCNKNNQHPTDSHNAIYSPVTGNSYSEGSPVIFQWTQNNQRVPKEVIVKDYNNDQPSVDLSAKALIDSSGMGEVFRYCDNLVDLDEAKELADIRAEELLMQKTRFYGNSLDVEICPAFPLNLSGHPLGKLNCDYTPISISHTGYAPDLSQIHQTNEQPYSNTIQAISADIQFRPELKTEKPRFYGVLNAIVDSEGDGQYAHLDSRGRYKVVLPFDRKGRDGAQASWWIPMSQPNAGDNSGMHFPLLKGAEVLLSFIGGDPDRPVITGAVPNASKPSVVREDNHTQNKIKTAANNIIEMEDEADSERIKLFSPNSNSYFHLGASNPINANGLMMMTSGGYYQEIGGGYQKTLVTADNLNGTLHTALVDSDNDSETPDVEIKKTDGTAAPATGRKKNLLNGSDVAVDLLNETSLHTFKIADESTGQLGVDMTADDERSGNYFIHREKGPKYFWNDGNTYTFGGSKDFSYGNSYEVNYVDYKNDSTHDGTFPNDVEWTKEELDKMLVTKTIGDAYEYHKGLWQEVHKGDYRAHNDGETFIEKSAFGAKLEAAVYGADIDAKLSGFSLELDVSLVKMSIDLTGIGLSLSKAAREIEFFAGKYEKGVKESIDLKAGKTFTAVSGEVLPTAITGIVTGAGAAAGAASIAQSVKDIDSKLFEIKYKPFPKAELELSHGDKKSILSLQTGAADTHKIALEENEATFLHKKAIKIDAGTELSLKAESSEATITNKATFKSKEIALAGSDSLSIDSKKVTIGDDLSTTNVTISSDNITLDTGANNIKITMSGIEMKSSSQAKINSQIIQLG